MPLAAGTELTSPFHPLFLFYIGRFTDPSHEPQLLGGGCVKSSQVLTPQSCKGQGACANKEGGMPTKKIARSLSLRTSLRLGSAPVRLACTQRGPERGLVLVCLERRRIPPHSTVALQIQRAPR